MNGEKSFLPKSFTPEEQDKHAADHEAWLSKHPELAGKSESFQRAKAAVDLVREAVESGVLDTHVKLADYIDEYAKWFEEMWAAGSITEEEYTEVANELSDIAGNFILKNDAPKGSA